jgi:hypothetical protein
MRGCISDNVGGVKYFLSTLRRALREERHFALVEGFAFSNRRLALNRFRSRVSPTHASLRSQPRLRHIQYKRTASFRAKATLAIFRPCPHHQV